MCLNMNVFLTLWVASPVDRLSSAASQWRLMLPLIRDPVLAHRHLRCSCVRLSGPILAHRCSSLVGLTIANRASTRWIQCSFQIWATRRKALDHLANADHVEETSMFITLRLEAFPLVRLLFMVQKPCVHTLFSVGQCSGKIFHLSDPS
jgi:hypothetical protein